jgi:hypothetical protein
MEIRFHIENIFFPRTFVEYLLRHGYLENMASNKFKCSVTWRLTTGILEPEDTGILGNSFQELLYCSVCIYCCGNLFIESFPSSVKGDTRTQTERWFHKPLLISRSKESGLNIIKQKYCRVYQWLKTGFRLIIGFIEHLQIITNLSISLSLIHTLCSSLQHVLSSQSALFTSGCSPAPGLTSSQVGGHLTPTSSSSNCRLKTQDSVLMAVGPHYIASARTAQRTPPQHLFHWCMRVHCGHYIAWASVYKTII